MATLAEYMAGAARYTSADFQMLPRHPRIVLIDPSGAGQVLKLPDARLVQPGGPHWYIVNLSTTYEFDIEDFEGNAVRLAHGNPTTAEGAKVWLAGNATAAGDWVLDVRSVY